MATDVGSPQRFFHMPRFQHQAPRQVFYKRPDFAQQQAMQQLTFDGKRMRKAVNRKTIDYNPSNRQWQRDHRDFRGIQPDAGCYNDLVPPLGMLNNPMNAVTTKFVRTSTNKVKCPVFVIRAHDSPVRAMTWSHNDMWMLTADHSGYVKYWQSNMNNVKMFQAHKEAIREARFTPNLPFSVAQTTGGRCHVLCLFWFITDRCKRVLLQHCSDLLIRCGLYLQVFLQISAASCCESSLRVFKHGATSPGKGECNEITFLLHPNCWFLSLVPRWGLIYLLKPDTKTRSFSPTDNKFATCSDDGTVRIWDFLRCHEERILRGHGADVKCVDWHPTKGLVVSGSKDSQQPINHAHKNTVMEVKWNLNGNWLLTASRDHLCKLFDIRNLKEELQVFRGHKKEATAVAWHPVHEGLFASGGSDGSLLFWHAGFCSGVPLSADKEVAPEVEMSIPGLDWGMDEVMGKDSKKVPQKKVPYAKPIPAQFQQVYVHA
ncbi:hypothetical protein XENOCAPTIV_026564 [Xenoophorus captivus]|uniref:WD repeat domain 33 n=1 Tax=Xenoophorus captivus TaxID=1517983 RepID=A0ABV0Q746_9TELE